MINIEDVQHFCQCIKSRELKAIEHHLLSEPRLAQCRIESSVPTTAWHLALRDKHLTALPLLMTLGAKPRGDNADLLRLFIDRAVFHRQASYDAHLTDLLTFCDPNVGDSDGLTPLMLATQHSKTIFVQQILPLCDPNVLDVQGRSALLHVNERDTTLLPLLLPVSDRAQRGSDGSDVWARAMNACSTGNVTQIQALGHHVDPRPVLACLRESNLRPSHPWYAWSTFHAQHHDIVQALAPCVAAWETKDLTTVANSIAFPNGMGAERPRL